MGARYKGRFRSRQWFDNPENPGMTALYLERYQNQAFTLEELQSGKPIIGIAQTGSDLSPCNKIHVFLADRVKAGIRDAGGSRWSSRSTRSRRPASARPRRWTGISPISRWSRCCRAIRSMPWC